MKFGKWNKIVECEGIGIKRKENVYRWVRERIRGRKVNIK